MSSTISVDTVIQPYYPHTYPFDDLKASIYHNDTISQEEYDNIDENDTNFLSAEEAYNMARDKNVVGEIDIYDKNNDILLTQNDLISIAQYEPPVDYASYVDIMKYSKVAILKKYPELKYIPNIDIVDMKFYVMTLSEDLNRYENEDPDFTTNLRKYSYYLGRGRRYFSLGEIGKSLILKIYDKINTYVKCLYPSPLEEFIISFDDYVENERHIIALADRYGMSILNIEIDIEIHVRDYLYSDISDVINKIYKNSKNMINYDPIVGQELTVSEIINMTYLEYLDIYQDALIEDYGMRLLKMIS
jgi:hypothetical protein